MVLSLAEVKNVCFLRSAIWVSCGISIIAMMGSQSAMDKCIQSMQHRLGFIKAQANKTLSDKPRMLREVESEIYEIEMSPMRMMFDILLRRDFYEAKTLQTDQRDTLVNLRTSALMHRLQNRCLGDNQGRVCWHEEYPDCHLDAAYNGSQIFTRHGSTCAEWNSNHGSAPHLLWKMTGNRCRNPNGRPGPWCYVEESTASIFLSHVSSALQHLIESFEGYDPEYLEPWDFCFEPCSITEECINDKRPGKKACWRSEWNRCKVLGAYTGGVSKTVDGTECATWRDVNASLYHGGLGNKCHVMMIDRGGKLLNEKSPWCYTDTEGNSGHCFSDCASKDTDPVIISAGSGSLDIDPFYGWHDDSDYVNAPPL